MERTIKFKEPVNHPRRAEEEKEKTAGISGIGSEALRLMLGERRDEEDELKDTCILQ
jgi:hypothetical protein